jgi:hypothetical protein
LLCSWQHSTLQLRHSIFSWFGEHICCCLHDTGRHMQQPGVVCSLTHPRCVLKPWQQR